MSTEATPTAAAETLPARRGRRTVRTPENSALLADLIGRGIPIGVACGVVGISKSVFFDWRESDEDFCRQLEGATSRAVESRLKIIETAAQNDWRAAAWLLERTVPEFSRQRSGEHVSYTQNNTLVIPRELLDRIAETRKQNEPKPIDTGTA